MIRRWLVAVGLWLAHLGGWTEPVPPDCTHLHLPEIAPDVWAKTQALVREYAPTGMGGEAKRHQVYARLIKEFPTASRSDLGLVIEYAVREFYIAVAR